MWRQYLLYGLVSTQQQEGWPDLLLFLPCSLHSPLPTFVKLNGADEQLLQEPFNSPGFQSAMHVGNCLHLLLTYLAVNDFHYCRIRNLWEAEYISQVIQQSLISKKTPFNFPWNVAACYDRPLLDLHWCNVVRTLSHIHYWLLLNILNVLYVIP